MWNQVLFLGIWFFLVGSSQQIIHTGVVKIGQTGQNFWWNHSLTIFIVGIRSLRNTNGFTKSTLRKVGIFPKVFQTSIHLHHHYKHILEQIVLLCFRTFCSKILWR